ncbi:tyrosine-type recombinase/integrase [Virgibacillus litoralis]|uniref:tyrosine-type recombinase/integrase n=1 Tax=Virgibacillus litoralis TaxID=578221 RepID=UPI00360AA25C
MLEDYPVFQSQKGGRHLEPSLVHRIVKNNAEKVGFKVLPPPHWFRHAHASHALDQKAPIHLVQATLGHENVATTGRYLHSKPNESSSTYISL